MAEAPYAHWRDEDQEHTCDDRGLPVGGSQGKEEGRLSASHSKLRCELGPLWDHQNDSHETNDSPEMHHPAIRANALRDFEFQRKNVRDEQGHAECRRNERYQEHEDSSEPSEAPVSRFLPSPDQGEHNREKQVETDDTGCQILLQHCQAKEMVPKG